MPHDCQVGPPELWPASKKGWCCEHANRGCPTTAPQFDCVAGFANWAQGWSPSKKAWCCQHASKGCQVLGTSSKRFDCNIEFSNWQAGWSAGKRAWCCQHESKGCPLPPPTL